MGSFRGIVSRVNRWKWTPAFMWGSFIIFVIAGHISRAANDKRPTPAPSYTYATPKPKPATATWSYAARTSTYTPTTPTIPDPFATAGAAVIPAAPFIEVDAHEGMRAWSNGRTLIYVKGGKLAGTVALGGSTTATEPPAGTPLYRANGTFAGWIGPDRARPPNIHSITVPPSFTPVAGENGSRRGDISAATGRPKTVYVNGYTRHDGTQVRSHWRSPPSAGQARGR